MVKAAAVLSRFVYRRGYGTVHYDRDNLAALFRLNIDHPIVFLPGHRSNLDRPVMHRLLWENGLGPNYTAGGINMNFFPIGPISRRAGVFFIRRSFKNSAVYKLVLQTYFAYLIEQRLPLEWYIEGGRSRTGKLRTPSYGLLSYAADALAAGKSDDIYLIPTSINYDHVIEVAAYTAEQQGVTKEKETFGWLLKSVRALRRRYGDIHVRFAEPISMRSLIDPTRTGAGRRRNLHELATRVCRRINRVTPVTPSSLAAAALLAGPDEGLSHPDLESIVIELAGNIESRNLPSTAPLPVLLTGQGLRGVVDTLADLGIAQVENGQGNSSGPEPTYRIPAGQRLAASYYLNTIVHFFVTQAVTELALAAAARARSGSGISPAFPTYVGKLKELLAFEFFLPDRNRLIHEIDAELSPRLPGWTERVSAGGAPEVLEQLRPHRAPWVLRSILEAYRVVARVLSELPAQQPWNREDFLAACLSRGAECVARQRIPAESSSLTLFSNGVRVAARRGLLRPGHEDLAAQRTAFFTELDQLLQSFDQLDIRVPGVGQAALTNMGSS